MSAPVSVKLYHFFHRWMDDLRLHVLLLTVFQSHQDDGWVIMKECVLEPGSRSIRFPSLARFEPRLVTESRSL